MVTVIAGLASAAAWLWLIHRADRFEREPLKILLYVGVVGGFVSAIGASLGNVLVMNLLGVGDDPGSAVPPTIAAAFSLFVGFNEEFFKAAATVFLVRRLSAFNEPLDAVVYGMTVALGFAAFENIEYVGEGGMPVLVARTLTAMPLHVGLAALWGAGIARARFGGGDAWIRNLLPWYGIAALIHALYDFALVAWPGSVVVGLVSLPCLIVTLVVARRTVKGLAIRSPFRPVFHCARCDRANPPSACYCAHCGAALGPERAKGCSSCRAVIPGNSRFCPECGAPQQALAGPPQPT